MVANLTSYRYDLTKIIKTDLLTNRGRIKVLLIKG